MADKPISHLRNKPRQARSAARVEHLLDVAAEIFEEVGYDAATTNLVAARAGVPVGTLYRWFPDKSALAEALADRYLENLMVVYEKLFSKLPAEQRVGEFLHVVMTALAEETQRQKALPALLVSAMVPGNHSPAGSRLREGLALHCRALLELRVPGIPDEIRDRAAEVVVTLAQLVIAAGAQGEGPERDEAISEYTDVMISYLEAKFPAVDHPAWSEPDPAVKPLFPAPDRARRLAAVDDAAAAHGDGIRPE